jgi:hypothetical protein
MSRFEYRLFLTILAVVPVLLLPPRDERAATSPQLSHARTSTGAPRAPVPAAPKRSAGARSAARTAADGGGLVELRVQQGRRRA